MAEVQDQQSNDLRTPSRFITSHSSHGFAVFDTSIPDILPSQDDGILELHLAYATTSTPVEFSNHTDVDKYKSFLATPPGIFVSGGSVLRIVDMRPGGETPLHQTPTLDYGVVIEGEIELVLDSEESRILKKGDISIQRGTNHLWRNTSQKNWGRMLFVTMDAKQEKD